VICGEERLRATNTGNEYEDIKVALGVGLSPGGGTEEDDFLGIVSLDGVQQESQSVSFPQAHTIQYIGGPSVVNRDRDIRGSVAAAQASASHSFPCSSSVRRFMWVRGQGLDWGDTS